MNQKKNKSDQELGLKVRDFLIEKGVETPIKECGLSFTQRKDILEESFKNIMEVLNLDLSDDSLEGTPARVSEMYLNEIFCGLDYANFPKCTAVENKMEYDELVIEKNINVQSNCEHHFVIIDGKCAIGYIPQKKVLGLSKLNRVVEFFSKRPQIQERLTSQIYWALACILETEDIAVVLSATHYCVKARGVQDASSVTITSKLGGKFKEVPDLRSEFMSLIG